MMSPGHNELKIDGEFANESGFLNCMKLGEIVDTSSSQRYYVKFQSN